MNTPRYCGTNVLLRRGGKVLLGRRKDTGWADGMLAIPGGHLMPGETARAAAVREMSEEVGLTLSLDRLTFFATACVFTTHENIYHEFYVDLKDDEEPVNTEPDRCSELVWCDPENLPDDIPDSFKAVIGQGYLRGVTYLEIGYDKHENPRQ